MRIADKLQRSIWDSLREINQRVGNVDWISAGVGSGHIVESAKSNLTVERQVIEPVKLYVPDVGAKLHRVPRRGVRDIVNPLKQVGCSTVRLINASSEVAHR